MLHGDIHTANQKAAGLTSRDQAKTFFYALMYGAGAEKISTITNQDGAKLKRKYYKNMPALAELTKRVTDKAEKEGYVKALDGRRIQIRSSHSSLNFLLQSAGALISKVWYIKCYELLQQEGLIYDQHAERLGQLAVKAAALAGEALGLRIEIAAEYKVGNTWAECH